MKTLRFSSKWKTDPRTAYVPGVILGSLVLVLCLFVGPAWSFETINVNEHPAIQPADTPTPSPAVADACLPLLDTSSQSPQPSAMDRNQRSAGKAAALGLVLGVRFALSPPNKAGLNAQKPRLDVWHPAEASNDRSALAVTAYRQCQKEQALKALGDFRWVR
ncbi:MAG: hypothetical protein JKY71_02645 [Alphaproteobacteria bacterium]|nr:hypothetical protein [Alphaproteobacteria bacterium]